MQQPKLKAKDPSEDEEPEELVHFRREWLAELKKKKSSTSAAITSPDAVVSELPSVTQSSAGKPPRDPWSVSATPQSHPGPSSQTISGHPFALSNAAIPSLEHSTTLLPRSVTSALNIYRQAVDHEQQGELDDALLLYRQAFRMDANVDRVYHREEKLASILTAKQAPKPHPDAGGADGSVLDELAKNTQRTLYLKSGGYNTVVVVTGTLADLVSKFPETLSFEPEMEQELVPLRKLPDELLVMILCQLDPTSIERFAIVNRKARILALESSIWKDLVSAIYKPPQVPDIESMKAVVQNYLSDFRRVYIEHPRVRMDGVYIATCHYVRPGLHENSWVNISHLITYHRYLRFYPNGQVLSLLANEEHTPHQIIPRLKPTLRMKGLFIGTWYLSGSTVHLSNLIDASGRFPIPNSWNPPSFLPSPSPLHQQAPNSASDVIERNRYAFLMSLSLRSRPLGRWNKLTMETYDSVNLETGDTSPVVLKHERPFWFSKVRSYATS